MSILFWIFVVGLANYSTAQFITVGSNNNIKPIKSTCEMANKSALVEHFFNIIFNEFHSSPPVCICVQMCPGQPTYCYPNDCLKRDEVRKKQQEPLPVTRVSENTKPIFLLDDKKDFMNDYLSKNYLDDNKGYGSGLSKPVNDLVQNIRPDPFKDRYKILYKYKKLPMVELKYNLGEQVRNMKSELLKKDNVDVSNTRWPINKINQLFGGQRMNQQSQGNSNSFVSILPEKETKSHAPKYFKRDLNKDTGIHKKDIDIIETYYKDVDKFKPENVTLEILLDSLIKNSDETRKEKKATTENYELKETSTISNFIIEENSLINLRNETTNVISLNLTNENLDKNKYTETNPKNCTNKFSEMIASLSKKIEMQNNTSMQIMRRINGNVDLSETTTMKYDKYEHTSLKPYIEIIPENAAPAISNEHKINRKSRQRFTRKYQHSKPN